MSEILPKEASLVSIRLDFKVNARFDAESTS